MLHLYLINVMEKENGTSGFELWTIEGNLKSRCLIQGIIVIEVPLIKTK